MLVAGEHSGHVTLLHHGKGCAVGVRQTGDSIVAFKELPRNPFDLWSNGDDFQCATGRDGLNPATKADSPRRRTPLSQGGISFVQDKVGR